MDRQNDCNATSRMLAQQHYEKALVMLYDGHKQEAVEALEKASQLRPTCEVYQQTLAQLKMSYNFSHPETTYFRQDSSGIDGFFDERSQEATKANLSCHCKRGHSGHPKETMANHVNMRETTTVTPNGKSNTNTSFKKLSPIDGLSHIELQEGSPDLLQSSDEFESEQVPASETKDTNCSSVPTNSWAFQDDSNSEISSKASSRPHETHGASSSDFKRDQYDNLCHDYFNTGGSGLDSDEVFEDKFLEQLCKAREACDDGCDKYLEMLNEICVENSDVSFPERDSPVSTSSTEFSGIDDFVKSYSDRLPGPTTITNAPLESEIPSVSSDRSFTRTKGGCSLYETTQTPVGGDQASVTDTEKERVYFMNGSCYSSSHPPRNPCPQTREDVPGKADQEKQKAHRTGKLSASEKDFYKNLGKYYFGGGKVKYKKEIAKENEGKYVEETGNNFKENQSGDGFVGSAGLGKNSQDLAAELQGPQVQGEKSPQFTVPSLPTSKLKGCYPGKGQVQSKTNCFFAKGSSTGLEGTEESKPLKKEDKRSSTFSSVKADQSSEAKRKLPVHGTQVQDKVQMPRGRRTAYPEQTGRRHKGKLRHKGRNVRGVAVNSPSLDQEQQEASRQCSSLDETTELQSKEVNFQNLQVWLQKTGKQFATRCGQTAISVLQYVIVLAMLLTFGLLIFPLSCAWYMVCKVYSAIVGKVKELCTSFRNIVTTKIFPWFGWFMGLLIKLFSYFGWFKNLRKSPEGGKCNLSMTRDEAVLKMISGKDQDPYSILGVSHDASEDDIRKHYRRLAVLIHPDKNDHPQADEAFKILADAFGQIGTSDKRMEYDTQAAWKRDDQRSRDENRGPRNFFSELHKQMKEMRNYLSCDVCGEKHRRYETDRAVSFARFCSHCGTHHAGKQGDMWAESGCFGMKIYFYACMDGAIFDVTEWAGCHGLHQGRITMNTHNAPWKVKTQSNSNYPFKSEEELFDDFFREVFFGNHFPPGDERAGTQNKARKKKRKKRR